MKKNKVTFADIAEYTGFSKTTISRYFNSPDSLTLDNQQKIAEALEALDYKQNKLAKVLANGKSEIVGVFSGNDNPETERRYISELLAYNIEGLIVLSHTVPSEELRKYNIPVVTIEREDRFVSSVNTDNYMGGVQAASLLVKSGCDIVIHVNGDLSEAVPAYGRIKGFREFCESKNINHRVILTESQQDTEAVYRT